VASLVLPVRAAIQATPRTRIIHSDLSGSDFQFKAGQAVFAGLAAGKVRRPYSIACSPTQAREQGMLELLVQIDDHRPPDPHLERAAEGTLLSIEGPMGSFGLPSPLRERHLLFIAGGTGIAPLRSMMWETLMADADVHIGVIYSARNREEFAYHDELVELAAQGRIDLRLTITRGARAEWTGGRGRIDATLIRSMLQTVETRALVCGPEALVAEAAKSLRAAGIAPERIVSETYGQ
jgi:ferredoxin-NADP reductase